MPEVPGLRVGAILLGALLVVPFVLGVTGGEGRPERDVAFAFADPAIVESSGLVVDDGRFVTTNDSGDRGRVFTVSDSGATVGLTWWAKRPVDVEALAPAGPGRVWVGDIGDNATARASVSVTRVPVGVGDRTVTEPTYRLVYPDGPRDAEALLSHPTSGRLYVVSKVVFGGRVYQAPAELDPDADNRLRPLGDVAGLVTDGAFFPDGRHLVLRTYSRAVVYTFPGLEEVGDFELPGQQQGEGLAVVGEDTLYLTSEGRRAPVLRVLLPVSISRNMAAPNPGPTPSPPTTDSRAAPPALPRGPPRPPRSGTPGRGCSAVECWCCS